MNRFMNWKMFVFPVLVLTLLFTNDYSAQAAKPIKIGCLFELTGFLAPIGKDARQGATIAMDQQQGKLLGRPLKFIIEDSATDVPTSMDKMRKLVEVDKVRIVVGPIFGSSLGAMGGYADKAQIPLISIVSLNVDNILKNKWAFSAVGTNESNGYPMGIFIAEKLGIKTITTLGSDFLAGHEFIGGLVKSFKLRGGKVVQQQWSPPGTTNMMPYLIAAKKEQADCLVTWWPGSEAFAGFKQYKELNIQMPIIEPEDGGILGNPAVNKHLGEGAIGAYTTVMYSYLADTPGNKEFVAAYQEKFGVPPSPLAGCGYVSTMIAIEGLKKAGPDCSSKELRTAITGLRLETIHGPLSFNKWRVATYTTPIVKIDKDFVPRIMGEYRVKSDVVDGKLEYSLEE